MNREAGFYASGSPYELTVAEKCTPSLIFKRVTLIAIYILWSLGWLLLGFSLRLIVPMLALVPLSVWILVFLTWRFTQVEYEYSFFSGVLTVSRILGGRTRRELCRVTLRSVDRVLPAEETHQAQIEGFGAEKTIYAVSNDESAAVFAVLWRGEDDRRMTLFFEPNEKAIKILQYYNRAAVTLSRGV